MKCRILCVIIACAIVLSNLNCTIVSAQEETSQEETFQEETSQEETSQEEIPQDIEEMVCEVEDFTHLSDVTEKDFAISYKNLRGADHTWVFSDESAYTLEIDATNICDFDDVEVRWNVTLKESGEDLKDGYQISEDGYAVYLDGTKLKEHELLNQALVVKASVYCEGVETTYNCETDVLVKEKTFNLKTKFSKSYELGSKRNYLKNFKAYIEDSDYPAGQEVSLHVDEVISSDNTIVEVMYDAKKDRWTGEAKKQGEVTISFMLSDEDDNYVVKNDISVICSHDRTYDVIQLENIFAQAKDWLGYKESDGSHMEIVDVYNAYTPLPLNYKVQKRDAWCATYVSAVAIKLGYTYLIPVECGCGRMIERFQVRNNWLENENCTPEPGWIIFYDWQDSGKGDNTGWPDHVGIVEKIVDGKITVIEGNYSDKVKRRTIDVNGRYIRGYGIPEYGKETVRATLSKKGYVLEGCAKCGDIKKTTIYPAKDISLSEDTFTYDGKTKELSVIVKDSKGKSVDPGEYYLSGSVSKASVGKYNIKVNLDGKKYEGIKTLSYTIYPKAPASVKAFLYGGHDDVKVTWEACSGADGYNVYYKQGSGGAYKELLSTTDTYCVKKNLTDGKKYYFKVVPYFVEGSEKIEGLKGKTASLYTLKKVEAPTVTKKTNTFVNIKWKDISDETGYQISKTLLRGNVKVCGKTNKNEINVKASKKINYYYKVRAYKEVDGKTIYGPWSEPIKYKLK